MNKPFIRYIECDLTNKCNLLCKGCSHFSPLTTKNNVFVFDLNQFEQDIKRLSELFFFFFLQLMGGEPLLLPNITDYIDICKKYLPYTTILILTNGTLPDIQNKIHAKYINDRLVRIHSSDYKIINGNGKKDSFHSIGLSEEPKFDLAESRISCRSKGCFSLAPQKLYFCNLVRNWYLYEDYYNINFNINDDNIGINIHNNSADDILKFLHYGGNGEACKHCNPRKVEFQWSKIQFDENNKIINDWKD